MKALCKATSLFKCCVYSRISQSCFFCCPELLRKSGNMADGMVSTVYLMNTGALFFRPESLRKSDNVADETINTVYLMNVEVCCFPTTIIRRRFPYFVFYLMALLVWCLAFLATHETPPQSFRAVFLIRVLLNGAASVVFGNCGT